MDTAPPIPYALAMDPVAAFERQIAAYRGMTGEERLGIALSLHALACEVARAGIRARFPEATSDEVERELRARIELGRRLAAAPARERT